MMRSSTTDRIFDWTYGTDTEKAFYRFQECITKHNDTGFGGGNPDLGGIGV